MGKRAHRPRRGSLAFSPRARAPSPVARVRAWPEDPSLNLQGFLGYKAGMTHLFVVDDRKTSPTAGQEVCIPATAIETPPIFVCGIKLYGRSSRGLRALGEVWAKELPKDLARLLNPPKRYDQKKAMEEAESMVKEERVTELRALVCTQPRLSNLPKKKPDLVEIRVGGGSIKERWEYCKQLLGKEVPVDQVLKEGEYVDVISITKGKGFQGPVKRWGIKILSRKQDDVKRKVGALGPWTPPRVMWTVPGAGQMGYHQRTELNKRILKIGRNGKEITPSGGFLRYGPIKSSYVLVAGSTPGSTKRLVHLRRAIRAQGPSAPPTITCLNTSSKQGCRK